jgi:hypothetical protein
MICINNIILNNKPPTAEHKLTWLGYLQPEDTNEYSSETSLDTYKTTRRHDPKNHNQHFSLQWELKFHNTKSSYDKLIRDVEYYVQEMLRKLWNFNLK